MMYSSKSLFKSIVIIVLLSDKFCNAVTDIKIDCKDFEGLCLGETYETTCIAPEDVKYHLMKVTECNNIEVDFIKSDSVNEVECDSDDSCGEFCGTLKQVSPNMTINMNFVATHSLIGASITCFGQSLTSAYTTTCSASLAAIPHPPTNVQVSDCSPTLVSWNEPETLYGKADQSLKYQVIIASTDKRHEFIVPENYMKLPMEWMQEMDMYSVCVSSINCAGISDPVCRIGNLKNFLIPPLLNATIINSTTINVSILPSHNESLENVCFDIETNLMTKIECVVGSSAMVHVGKANTVHTIRVRTRIDDTIGKWSNPACVLFSTPPAVLFQNYTITDQSTITISVKLQDVSALISNCQTLPAQTLQVIASNGSSVEVEVNKGEMEKVVTLNLTSTAEKITITGRATNGIGIGPENSYTIII